MHFESAFIVISFYLRKSFLSHWNTCLKTLSSKERKSYFNSSPHCTECHRSLEDPLSCQELPNDKRKNDEKKWNLGADLLKAKIPPETSGYKRKVSVLPPKTADHINLFK